MTTSRQEKEEGQDATRDDRQAAESGDSHAEQQRESLKVHGDKLEKVLPTDRPSNR